MQSPSDCARYDASTDTIDGVAAEVSVVDGRVAMDAEVTETLYVKTPDHAPLTARERHCSLYLVGDGIRVTLELDGERLDTLADALAGVAGGDGDARR
jgi:hypothetical protein